GGVYGGAAADDDAQQQGKMRPVLIEERLQGRHASTPYQPGVGWREAPSLPEGRRGRGPLLALAMPPVSCVNGSCCKRPVKRAHCHEKSGGFLCVQYCFGFWVCPFQSSFFCSSSGKT